MKLVPSGAENREQLTFILKQLETKRVSFMALEADSSVVCGSNEKRQNNGPVLSLTVHGNLMDSIR